MRGYVYRTRAIPMPKKKPTPKPRSKKPAKRSAAANTKAPQAKIPKAVSSSRTYDIPDYRLERPDFRVYQSGEGSSVEYKIEGDLSAPAPPIRESKYLSRKQCLEIYRWMLLNRRMETVLENLYKQSLVVGGVYFGLGQEGCSCASAYACAKTTGSAP